MGIICRLTQTCYFKTCPDNCDCYATCGTGAACPEPGCCTALDSNCIKIENTLKKILVGTVMYYQYKIITDRITITKKNLNNEY